MQKKKFFNMSVVQKIFIYTIITTYIYYVQAEFVYDFSCLIGGETSYVGNYTNASNIALVPPDQMVFTNTIINNVKNDTILEEKVEKNCLFRNYNGTEIIVMDGACKTAVDHKKNEIYISGEAGIYKYDANFTKLRVVTKHTKAIHHMFFKRALYYTTYPNFKAYIYHKNKSLPIGNLKKVKTERLALDAENNLYVSNSTGLYGYLGKERTPKFYDSFVVNHMTTDSGDREVYFSTDHVIFRITEGGKRIEPVLILRKPITGFVPEIPRVFYATPVEIQYTEIPRRLCREL